MNRSMLLLRFLLRKSSSLCKPLVPIPAPKPSGNLNSIKEPQPSKGRRNDGGKGGGNASWLFWKRMSIFVAFPIVAICMLNVILFHQKLKRPMFIEYEYLRIRNKRFPWGDGQRTLFHNPRVNALPGGYETEIPEEEYAEDHEISDDVQEEAVSDGSDAADGKGDGNKLADSIRKNKIPIIHSLKDQIMEDVKEGTKGVPKL